jgi:hypothetical protein
MISALGRWNDEPLSLYQIHNSWQSACGDGKIWEMSCRLTRELRLQFLFSFWQTIAQQTLTRTRNNGQRYPRYQLLNHWYLEILTAVTIYIVINRNYLISTILLWLDLKLSILLNNIQIIKFSSKFIQYHWIWFKGAGMDPAGIFWGCLRATRLSCCRSLGAQPPVGSRGGAPGGGGKGSGAPRKIFEKMKPLKRNLAIEKEGGLSQIGEIKKSVFTYLRQCWRI